MLDTIRQFFEGHIKGGAAAPANGMPNPIQVATAALLIEMTRMDGQAQEAERARVKRAIETKFELPPEEITELLRLAEQEAHEATDYYQFTSLVKQRFTPAEKERLIEHLWAVAYADGHLNPYEEHLVRKIADLIYVPHAVFIAAKLRARPAASE
jgi:uncharacterized tellurite resistance protein B-like protein